METMSLNVKSIQKALDPIYVKIIAFQQNIQ